MTLFSFNFVILNPTEGPPSFASSIEITSLINLKSITSDLNCTVILKLESKKSGDDIKCRIYLLQLTKLND